MNNKETGGPAFPHIDSGCGRFEAGITRREYFAAKAVQGLLSDPGWRHDMDFEDTAHAAYKQADAMLKAGEA